MTATRRRVRVFTTLFTAGLALGTASCKDPPTDTTTAVNASRSCEHEGSGDDDDFNGVLRARVVATGIPGAGAITEVGSFLTGSPIHDKAAFAALALPGQVLDPKRVLVASTSNYGAPLARPGEPEGSVLSIDPSSGQVVSVPAGFAAAGGQASAQGGAVQVYAAQSPAFLNSLFEPQAVTAALPSASLPTGISINSGNGRPWVANAPYGATGDGTLTVLDPGGFPLAGAPFAVAGGVFSGNLTNRSAATTHGLTSATLGTAILTKSPDLSGKAVFVTVNADGSVTQVHVKFGVDGLAPPGTVTPVAVVDRNAAESTDPQVITREGMAFNWVPTRNVFIADPQASRLVVLDLTDDGTRFAATSRQIRACELNVPIDITPTVREVSSANFASNTTLGGGSDLYVLNRGDNSIVRMSTAGKVLARRTIQAAVPGFRVNGIAVSSDSRTLYVTAATPGHQGVVLAVPSFGAGDTTPQLLSEAQAAGMSATMTDIGNFLFSVSATPQQGLGPLFNATSCVSCHSTPFAGGMGVTANQSIVAVGKLTADGTKFDPLTGQGGPTARFHSIAEFGYKCELKTGVPPQANVSSRRSAMTLRGNGLLDTIVLGDVLANMATQPAAVRGRPNLLADGRMGKFGWKANVATLVEFMGDAYRNELGLTNPIQPKDEINGCNANKDSPELDGVPLQAVASFLNTLDPPAPTAACLASAGATLFTTVGCASCHSPSLPGRGAKVNLYSDLLLHDMGPGLADRMQQGSATGSEWRTMPLWRAAERQKFLHDGRANTVKDAITAHGGQGAAASAAFQALDAASQQAVLDFVGCI